MPGPSPRPPASSVQAERRGSVTRPRAVAGSSGAGEPGWPAVAVTLTRSAISGQAKG
jgi:hypothetical protein